MGSMKQPNWGGSGRPFSRKSRPENRKFIVAPYEKIKTLNELNIYLSGEKIACLICGREFKSLGHHLQRTHAMGSKEYKEKFNIPSTRGLSGVGLKKKKQEIMKKNWQENPEMEKVRTRLKKDAHKLKGSEFKSKSTLAKVKTKKGVKKTVKAVKAHFYNKYRERYMLEITEAIEKKQTLFTTAKSTYQIYEFAKRNPSDLEFINKLNLVKKTGHLKPGEATFEKKCEYCKKLFTTRVKREAKTCSRECSAKIRVKRFKKECVVCGKKMLLTKSDFNKLTTCGSKQCIKKRRSGNKKGKLKKI